MTHPHHHHHQHNYTGSYPVPFPLHGHHPHAPPGHCRSCGQPSGQCGCGCRVCRKESKELLVEAKARGGDATSPQVFASLHKMFADQSPNAVAGATVSAAAAGPAQLGLGSAFIGGGCCVHLSVEYTPVSPTAVSIVLILVRDSEGTIMAWERIEQPGAHYQVKECVITTKPGASMLVLVSNMVARVRWCEIFSC